MSISPQQAAIDRATGLACWTKVEHAEILGGGMTNINVRLRDQGRDFVVRLGADIVHHGVMRFNELAISRAAHGAGLSPAVHYSEPGVMVLEFVDAQPLVEADLRDPATLDQVVDLVAHCHRDVALHLRGPVLAFWVFHILRDYGARLAKRASPHAPILPELMEQARRLEAAVGPVRLVLGHNDLLAANILRGADRLWLIDWEYGGFNSPLFDLGGLASNSGLGAGQEVAMLERYYDAPVTDVLMYRYTAMKCASLLRETLWSMVSELMSEIDVDYGAYSANNLSRYRNTFGQFEIMGA
jgi:thiamine kinase-like enzyme